jgi:mRNA-degrading endonuclease toxin of MazEF toxin-antitoxin module
MKRGEIRRYTFRPPDKRRPVAPLTQDAVIEQLGEIIAAPATLQWQETRRRPGSCGPREPID